MAIQLFKIDEPDCSQWAYGKSSDFLRSVVDPTDFVTTYDLRRTFPDTLGTPAFQPGLTGESLIVDPNMQVAYLVRNGFMKVIGGTYGFCGYRDGQGNQALLGCGALQSITYGTARNSSGNWFHTDGKNNKIRKWVEQGNGSWVVSTFANVNFPNTIGCDPSDNVWTIEGGLLKKFAPNGTLSNQYGLPASTIIGLIIIPNGHILMMTRNNSWDIIYNFDPATGVSTRIAGMNDAEVAAYEAAHGGSRLVDGAAIGEATFHSAGLAAYNSDGSLILTAGGDEHQVRKVQGGRVSSLFPNGTYSESQDRLTAETSDPNRPYFVVNAGGLQGNGYPWEFPFSFIPQGGNKAVKALTPIDIGEPGAVNGSSFVSQSVPSTVVAGANFSVTVVFHNSGGTTWANSSNHHLGSQGPQDSTTWNFPSGGNRVLLPGNVAPGADATLTFQATAPTTAGGYNFQTRMVQDGVEWFGAFSPNVVITVTPAASTAIPVTIQIKL